MQLLTGVIGIAGALLFATGYILERYHSRAFEVFHDRMATAAEADRDDLMDQEWERFHDDTLFDLAQVAFMPCYIIGAGLMTVAAVWWLGIG